MIRTIYKCKACKQQYDIALFLDNTGARKYRLCRNCRLLRKKTLTRWDWADSISKQTKMSVKKLNAPSDYYSALLTTDVLRAIMRLQKNKCFLCNEDFILPDSSNLTRHMTINQWLKHQPHIVQLKAPALVKINMKDAWEIGNVFFICMKFYPLYIQYFTFHDFIIDLKKISNTIQQFNEFIFPTKDTILNEIHHANILTT